MKKLIIISIALTSIPAFASYTLPAGGYYETRTSNCDRAHMQQALDDATAARRAIITVVRCDQTRPAPRATVDYDVAPRAAVDFVPAPAPMYVAPCHTCGDIVERVVDRRYYVEETIQQYRPVTHYVPAGEIIHRRPACPSCEM